MATSDVYVTDQSEIEDINLDDDPKNVDGFKQNALHKAAYGDTKKLRNLINSGQFNMNDCDAQGRSAVHIAAARNNVEVLEILASENETDLDIRTFEDQQAPIHYAAKYNALCSLLYLCECGANIEARDRRLRTPLFLAVEYGHIKAAQLLLQYDVDFRIIDVSGQTMLSLMIMKMPDVAKECLDKLIYHDYISQRSYYYLKCLEPIDNKTLKGMYSRRSMQFIVQYKLYNLTKHPIVEKFVNIKWRIYGIMEMYVLLIANLIFLSTWILFLILNSRREIGTTTEVHVYIATGVFCIAEVLFLISKEIYRLLDVKSVFEMWKKQQEQAFTFELQNCNPAWPEDQVYLRKKLKELSDMKPNYHVTLWNFLEYVLHIILLFLAFVEFIYFILRDRILQTRVSEIFSVILIPLWLFNLKFLRTFRFFGLFIFLLQKTWLILAKYLVILVFICMAFSLSIFFMNKVQFENFDLLYILLKTMFQKPFLSKLENSYMKVIYPILTFILAASLVLFGGFLCRNLFIAMLSQVVSRNQGNLDADLTMERLKILVQRDQCSSFYHDRLISHFYICKMCAPLEIYHNIDANTSLQEHLKQSCTAITQQLHELGVFLKTKMIDDQGYGGLQQRKQEDKSVTVIQQEVKLLQNKMVTMVRNQEKKNRLLSLELQLLSCLVETMGVALKRDSSTHSVGTQ